MGKLVDGRGKDCPMPVIMTKKELDSDYKGIINVIVDNKVAKENVSRLIDSSGYEYKVSEKDGEYHIDIDKGGDSNIVLEKEIEDIKDMTIAISSDIMGNGDKELGHILMKSYIYTVSETKPYPKNLLFYNTGVRLTCKDSPVLDDLERLKENGVQIVSCGTCLDFLDLKEDLMIGEISNMYTIYEKISGAKTNIII